VASVDSFDKRLSTTGTLDPQETLDMKNSSASFFFHVITKKSDKTLHGAGEK
jgi:hypothetical protein